MFEPIPHAGRTLRLLAQQLFVERNIEAEEIDQLAGAVDLGLMAGLALAEHRRRVDDIAIRALQQLGGFQEHRRARFPRKIRPILLRAERGANRHLHFRFAALMEIGEHMRVAMRHHRLAELARADVLAIDDQRYLDFPGGHLRQFRLKAGALRRPRRITLHRLVEGRGNFRDREGHGQLLGKRAL